MPGLMLDLGKAKVLFGQNFSAMNNIFLLAENHKPVDLSQSYQTPFIRNVLRRCAHRNVMPVREILKCTNSTRSGPGGFYLVCGACV